MSRIFDALQRSERERVGTDSATLPEGPDFLKRAERDAASKWVDPPSVDTTPLPPVTEGDFFRETRAALEEAPVVAAPTPKSEVLSTEERRTIVSQFRSMPINLSLQSRLVCLSDRESPTAEALRLLGVRLRDLRRVRPLKRVLITSTIPQEGKSTIASNLACTLSHAPQERTLLIEGDLRRPSLSRMFGIRPDSGISECIRDQKTPFQTVVRLEEAGIWIWPAGTAPSNPLELLQSPRLPALMDQLAGYFDWIVIDSPPVLPLADTSVWMRVADGILLVTRQGTTEKKQLQKGLEALDPKKMLGALLNGALASAYSGYYYRSPSHS
jgi:capsular exopolysaccharide synthesis family protein